MELGIKDKIAKILDDVSAIAEVRAIGRTGDINIVPKAGESDIDIFVLGDKVPDYDCRKAVYDRNGPLFEECKMNVCEGGVWGTGDVFMIDGVETMLMYFSIIETLNYVGEILEGKHLDRVDGFYPVGRCSTLKNIGVLYDESGILGSLKEKLAIYLDELKNEMVKFHLGGINNEEDFGRAVRRKDVLFYH